MAFAALATWFVDLPLPKEIKETVQHNVMYVYDHSRKVYIGTLFDNDFNVIEHLGEFTEFGAVFEKLDNNQFFRSS